MELRVVHKSPGIGIEPNRAAKIGDLFEGVHPEPSEESPVSVNGADDQPATTIDKTDSSKEGATLAEQTNTTHSDSVKWDDMASRIERKTLLFFGDCSRKELLKQIVDNEMRKKQNKKRIDYYSRYLKELEFLRRTVEVAHEVKMLEYHGAPDEYDDNLNYEVWMYEKSRSVKWDTIIKKSADNFDFLNIFLDTMKSSLSSEDFLRIDRIVQSTLNSCYNRIRANLISGETGESVVEDPYVSIVMNGLEASKVMKMF